MGSSHSFSKSKKSQKINNTLVGYTQNNDLTNQHENENFKLLRLGYLDGIKCYDKNRDSVQGSLFSILSFRDMETDNTDIECIEIRFLDNSANVNNFKKIVNLKKMVIFTNLSTSFYNVIPLIPNLEELYIYFSHNIYINISVIIDTILKCNKLKKIGLNLRFNYFPIEILRLNFLNILIIEPNFISTIEIPDEILKLNLDYLRINTNQKFIQYQNKMLIFNLNYNVEISDSINDLFIIKYDDKYINNLPCHIETLKIQHTNGGSLVNLPLCLKTLYIHTTTYNSKYNLDSEKIKLPFGCEIYYFFLYKSFMR